MKKNTKIILLFSLLFIFGLAWYLFLKKADYIIQFKEKTSPGTLYTSAEEWNFLNGKRGDFTHNYIAKEPYDYLHQELSKDGLKLQLDWDFIAVNDSVTEVTMSFSEKNKGLFNRITAPFIETKFKKTILELATNYKAGIDFILKEKFRVHSITKDTIPKMHYAYVSLKNIKMRDKASLMMQNNGTILNYLSHHNIEKNGFPFIVVDSWDLLENTIDFRYCFPIKTKDSLPESREIKFGETERKISLKAIYNGNYINSDRGWFALHEYAKRHSINIEKTPLEIFYNNPFVDTAELNWVTEIYIPIEKN